MRTGQHVPTKTGAQAHRNWLALVDTAGPFLAVPELLRVWPQGMPSLRVQKAGAERLRQLHTRKERFEQEWDRWKRVSLRLDDAQALADALTKYREQRDVWVRFVLETLLDWRDDYQELDATNAEAYLVSSPNGLVSAAPNGRLRMGDATGALVLITDPVASDLTDMPDDGWNANPLDRMEMMLRQRMSDCSIGIVTDGRWWAIVSAPKDGPAAWGQFDAQMWIDTPNVRDAFINLLGVRQLITSAPADRLPALFAGSVTAAEEITETLGAQVRQSVELIVAAFGESAARNHADVLPDGDEVYQAAVTVMMRIIFLLFAQERGLLPQGGLFDASYGMAGVFDELETRALSEGEEGMDGTSLSWHRLLATSRALYNGANFEDMRLPAYGGSVFDPERYSFLTDMDEQGELVITVTDRVMLHVLRSIQIAHVHGEARRVSFRDMDVEQIGYIYEGLLGYTCKRADTIMVGLDGKAGCEPEIPLEDLEHIARACGEDPDGTKRAKAIQAWVKKHEPGARAVSGKKLSAQLTATSTEEDERALLTVADDAALRDRLRPWIALTRRDMRGKPFILLDGMMYVEETSSRKDAGAHYTPRALAEEVVEQALEPLVYNPGPLQTSDRSKWRHVDSDTLLNLHVADIACGSGAFLVAAARYLARELVEAWRQEGTLPALEPERILLSATRKVVSSCLYGVDINDMAVEMCKLSLWLISLDKSKPFSFVDNKILHGNTLLGVTNLAQVERRRIDADETPPLLLEMNAAGQYAIAEDTNETMRTVRRLRRQLAEEINNGDPQRSAKAKQRQMRDIDKALAHSRTIADGVIAAGLLAGGKPGKDWDSCYEDLTIAVGRAYPVVGEGDTSMLDDLVDRGLTPTVPTDYERWECVHWPLEIPEVMENGGFDAIVGNPPFLGGQKLTGAMGTNVREWIVSTIGGGNRGSADLCAYFFLRAFTIMRPGGTLGLLATNTIAQGATREVGLDRMMAERFTIYRSIRSQSWPVKSANLEYATIWGVKGVIPDAVQRNCDGMNVARISSLLESQGRVEGRPKPLEENANISFQGCIVLGQGFVISKEQADEWIAADSRNREVLHPYLNGKDLNSRPDCSASRWVIDFNDWPEERAKTYVLPYKYILESVKYERKEKKDKAVKDASWWLFLRSRPALRNAIASLEHVLVITLVSKTVMPMRVITGQIFSNALGVFATDSYADQAVLSSSLHQYWAIAHGSSMRDDLRYVPSNVFETFPRPRSTEALCRIGKILDEERREIMLRRQLGLTALYNLVNSPDVADDDDADIARMRAIHRELDETVMAAYGWSDVDLRHGFYEYRDVTRWTVCPQARVEILDRLLEENHRRANAERE
ncbi:Methyltransferase domain-containing protein [Bifidobacterium italicum]|uniref:site-specific DNA-methyltransferase (adenine-specific) n=2 Tax=Bifidobacterium italicum TaxID=1960968 RepID=A0A2A2EJQ4_9BIFI|nr:Methyltransferase domain-containing protein [Bifidobacterium italicum]